MTLNIRDIQNNRELFGFIALLNLYAQQFPNKSRNKLDFESACLIHKKNPADFTEQELNYIKLYAPAFNTEKFIIRKKRKEEKLENIKDESIYHKVVKQETLTQEDINKLAKSYNKQDEKPRPTNNDKADNLKKLQELQMALKKQKLDYQNNNKARMRYIGSETDINLRRDGIPLEIGMRGR